MDPKTRELLQAPFERHLIRERTGPGGRTLSYVEVSQYIARLNEAFEGSWTYEITETKLLEDEAIVQVRLSVAGMVKMAIGGAPITRRRDNGKPVSLAHDLMSAEATSLKRACRLLGIGASLYEDDEPEVTQARPEPMEAPPRPQPPREAPPAQATHTRITNAQIGKLRALVAESGGDWGAYRNAIRDRHGVNLEYAERSLASALIGELLDPPTTPPPRASINGQRTNGTRVANSNWRRP